MSQILQDFAQEDNSESTHQGDDLLDLMDTLIN